MTGDARRLFAWKGLGGTPATVFTITFPPTVAERHKEKQINNGDRNRAVLPAMCANLPAWMVVPTVAFFIAPACKR